MKSLICVCLFAMSSPAISQGSYPLGDDQVRSEMGESGLRSDDVFSRTDFGMTTGFAGFEIDDVARQGVSVDLHALLARVSPLRFELNAGIVMYRSSRIGRGSLDVFPVHLPIECLFCRPF